MEIKAQLISSLNSSKNAQQQKENKTNLEKMDMLAESVHIEMKFNHGEVHTDSVVNLLYKNAVDAIDKYFFEIKGVENKTENELSATIDYSPQATAERIVQFGTGFFHIYQNNHPKEDNNEAKENFAEIIKKAIDEGFTNARNILEALEVLDGDITNNVDKTYAHVLIKLDNFLNA